MKIECYELNKLKTYLDKHKIEYINKSDPLTGEDRGLLELYTTQIQPDPFGMLTCAEVIELIEKIYGGLNMESFNEKMFEIAGSVSNKHLQLSFYDLQHFLVYSTSTPEVISKNK
jgi:hypothetical protein